MHWPDPPFEVPDEVYATWRSQVAERAQARHQWLARFEAYRCARPDLAAAHGGLRPFGAGSEVAVTLGARDLLAKEGIGARAVSLASLELFFERAQAERDQVLPPRLPRVVVEAASPFGWPGLAEEVVGLESFGRSGRGPDLYRLFGLTPAAVAAAAKQSIASSAVPQR